jgi:hypothetical protein
VILLASTSDEIRLVTADASTIDVLTSWADNDAGAITPGRTNTLISTATTTTIVGSPGASVYRSAKTISIRNRSTTAPCRITVIHRASGPVDVEMIQALLQPQDTLTYTEHDAWRYMRGPYGTLASAHDRVWLVPAIGAVYTQVLPASIVHTNATANRLAEVKELQFPVVEGHRYWFNYFLMYTVSATSSGSRWSIQGPGSPTALRYISENSLTTTSKTTTEGHAAYDLPAASNATSAATGANIAQIEGFIDVPTCNGIVFPRFAHEVAAATVTLLRGSRLEWQRVT